MRNYGITSSPGSATISPAVESEDARRDALRRFGRPVFLNATHDTDIHVWLDSVVLDLRSRSTGSQASEAMLVMLAFLITAFAACAFFFSSIMD
jgi:hypothetical protein